MILLSTLLRLVSGLRYGIRNFSRTWLLAVIAAYLGIGIAVTCAVEEKPCESEQALAKFAEQGGGDGECMEKLTFIDGFYFAVVTISTVGYGDFSPSTDWMRFFTCCYILVGCSYIFEHLSELFAGALEAYRQAVLAFLDFFDHSPTSVDTTGDGKGDTEVSGRSKGISGREMDLDGDGQIDFVEPPSALLYWVQELLPAAILWGVMQCVSAGIFMAVQDDLTFGVAFYHCFITATTVGYGDVRLHREGARLWASVHILVSVSWLAALIGQINECRDSRKTQLQRAALLTQPLDHNMVLEMDRDGQGIDKTEFVVSMLKILGVELCGEPLRWDDVRPFLTTFDKLDVSRTGTISKSDLELFHKQECERQQQLREKWSARRLGSRRSKLGAPKSGTSRKVQPTEEPAILPPPQEPATGGEMLK